MLLRCRTCGTQVPDADTTDDGRDDLGDVIYLCRPCADRRAAAPPHPRMSPRL